MIEFAKKVKILLSEKKNLYIFLTVGILILISSNFMVPKKEESLNNDTAKSFNMFNDEKRLEEILSTVEGAGKTTVMITYETEGEKVALQNSKLNKRNSDGDNPSKNTEYTEERETVMDGGGSSQTPFITKEITPRVRGVIVVAEGGGNNKIRFELTKAVSAVLDVPYYRIQVLKKSN